MIISVHDHLTSFNFVFIQGTIVERGIATWQCIDIPDVPKAIYAEGAELYVPPMPARMRRSKILRFIPFLPNPTN